MKCKDCNETTESRFTEIGELRECPKCNIGYDVETMKWYSLGDGEYLDNQNY